MQTTSEIASTYRALGIAVSRVETKDDDLVKFHESALKVIASECKRAADAVAAVDSGLRADVAGQRKRAILTACRARMEAALTGLVENIFGSRLRIARGLFDRHGNPVPSDPVEALRFQARVDSARAQLQALDMGDRAAAARKLAEAGDARFLPIFRDSLVDILPQQVLDALTTDYFKAAAGPQAAYVEATQEAIEEAQSIARIAHVALGASCAHAGLSLADTSMAPDAVVNALAPSIKAVFVARHGADALAEVATGKRDLAELAELL